MKDTIIIGRVGFYCGSVHITTKNSWVTDNALIVTHNQNINVNLLKIFLQALNLSHTSNSTAQPVVSGKGILPLLCPIPPINEQKIITKKYKHFLSTIQLLEKEVDGINENIISLKNKILDDIFGETSRYKSYYTQTQEKLENIASLITKGSTPTSYGFQYVDKGISFVKVENVHDYYIDHTTIRQFITVDAHEFQKRSQLQENDMLFSIAGTIGRICLVKTEDLPANTNQAFAIIRGYDKILIPSYLKWYLTWYLNDKSKLSGHGGGMLNITLNDLKKLEVFYPINKNDQQILVDRVEKLMEVLSSIS